MDCEIEFPSYFKKKKHRLKHLSVPKKLEIRGKTWYIYYAKDMPDWAIREGCQEDMEDCWGLTIPSKKTIILADDLKKHGNRSIRDMVLVHELLHSTLPVSEQARKRIIGTNIEERFIDAVSPALLEIMTQLKWRR